MLSLHEMCVALVLGRFFPADGFVAQETLTFTYGNEGYSRAQVLTFPADFKSHPQLRREQEEADAREHARVAAEQERLRQERIAAEARQAQLAAASERERQEAEARERARLAALSSDSRAVLGVSRFNDQYQCHIYAARLNEDQLEVDFFAQCDGSLGPLNPPVASSLIGSITGARVNPSNVQYQLEQDGERYKGTMCFAAAGFLSEEAVGLEYGNAG